MVTSNLPSITTRKPGDKRSVAKRSTETTNLSNLPEKVGEMIEVTRIGNVMVNEDDFKRVVKNMGKLSKDNKKLKQVSQMYETYQQMWDSCLDKNNVLEEYNNVELMKFFNEIKPRYSF